MPAFAEIVLWKVQGHLSTVEAGGKFAGWTSMFRWNNAYGVELFADKNMRCFTVVTCVGEELVERLYPVSGDSSESDFSMVWIRSPVGNGRDVKIILGIADCCELGIAAFLEAATLTVVG